MSETTKIKPACINCGRKFRPRTWQGQAIGRTVSMTERACRKCRNAVENNHR